MHGRDVLEQGFVEGAALLRTQRGDGAIEIDGVPQHDRRDGEIQAARAMALQFVRAVVQLAEPVKTHSAGQ